LNKQFTEKKMTASFYYLQFIIVLVVFTERSTTYAFLSLGTTHKKHSHASLLSSTTTELKMATWSDARAVREYQDFLATGKSEIEKRKDGPCMIITLSEENNNEMIIASRAMGHALYEMGMGDDIVMTPEQLLINEVPSSIGGRTEYPIYITLPPTHLKIFLLNDAIIKTKLYDRTDDFVFLSGGGACYGNIEKVLKDTGYCRDTTTQFLCTGFTATADGGGGLLLRDCSTTLGLAENGEEKFAGECAACGKWSGAVEGRLESNAIRCKTVFYREWRRLMWERNVFDALFHLVGAVRVQTPLTISDVALYHGDEISDMAWSISSHLRGRKALTLTYGFEERIFAVGEANGANQPCIIRADMFPYIYDEFLLVSNLNEYLCYAQDKCGLLPEITFWRQSSATKGGKSPFLEGVLRADGAI